MFTGIIEEIGVIRSINNSGDKRKYTIRCSKVLEEITKGDSISVNGVCLTAETFGGDYFVADVMNETVKATAFGSYSIGDRVNLERALTLNKPLGGHIVSGHVDCVGKIKRKSKDGNATLVKIEFPKNKDELIIHRGSISVDGISLTVMNLGSGWFELSIIPTTADDTILLKKRVGDLVNLEFDLLGKYLKKSNDVNVEIKEEKKSKITMDFLRRNGF